MFQELFRKLGYFSIQTRVVNVVVMLFSLKQSFMYIFTYRFFICLYYIPHSLLVFAL